MRPLDSALPLRSIEMCEARGGNFAGAHFGASAEAAGIREIVSSDRSLDHVPTSARIEPSSTTRPSRQ